jgi:hypothetical protein
VPAAVRWANAADADTISVWQRQMVLGPAPEFCLAAGAAPHGRERVA